MSTTEEDIYNRITSGKAFEGAATNYKTGLRGLLRGEADSLAVRELEYLQSRSEHIARNNGYGRIAMKSWVTNANSIKVIWKNPDGSKHELMQKYWSEFEKNPSYDNFGDKRTFDGVSNASIFKTGASHIRKLIVREGNSNTIPLKLQLIPTSLHAVGYNMPSSASSDVVRYGITFKNSIPTKYHYKKSILESASIATQAYTSVPAEEIIHTFIREEPGQWLGIPLLSSVLLSLYELDDLLTATVTKQKAAQSIVLVVEQVGVAMGLLPAGKAQTLLDPETGKQKVIFKNDATEAQVLYPNKGESVKSFQGTDIGANFGVLVETELRKIAAVADLAYHELTGDTAGLNFSSLIGLAIKSRNRLEYLHNFTFIPLRERPIAEAFKDLAVLYNSKCTSAIPYFQLPRWRGMDDLKDAQADILELQNGLGTYTDKLAERGLSLEDVLADQSVQEQLKSFGVEFTNIAPDPGMAQAGNIESNSNSTGN